MYLLAWIVIGAVVGWGAGRVLQGNGYGPLMDILMGIGGAVVGGFTMSFAGLGGYGGTIITTLVAMFGAVLLTGIAAYVNSHTEAFDPLAAANAIVQMRPQSNIRF